MTPTRTVVLDNEAVQALIDPAHRKHRRAVSIIEAVTGRNRRRAGTVGLIVPTAVRVEAGWDRRAAGSAAINRFRARDADLDGVAADQAARVRNDLRMSVPDAAMAVAIQSATPPVALVTSDVADAERIAEHLDIDLHPVAV